MPYIHEISKTELATLSIIRDIRNSLGISQAELARQTDYSRQGIANLEYNRNGTTWANALVILQRLGCTVTVECHALDRVYVVKDEE